jgi:hypothetical protein
MVMTHQSRTSNTRHYRLIAANGERIDDVTALVCSAIGKLWDNVRGTYNARGTVRSEDSSDLAYHLQRWCGIKADVVVL